MTESFLNQVLKNVVATLCQNIGWHAAQTSAIDILADLTKRHFLQVAKSAHNYAELCNRTSVNVNDVMLAFRENDITIGELEEYIQNFDPVVLPYAKDVPNFPVPKESKLNFLRPGSDEVLTRPCHVHEYMPPMLLHDDNAEKGTKEGETSDKVNGEADGDTADKEKNGWKDGTPEPDGLKKEDANGTGKSSGLDAMNLDNDDSSEDEIEALGSNKSPKGFVPFSITSKGKRGGSNENAALKRVRMLLEEDGHPLREITSVMMTTSGFLSSSREGRLPETRPSGNREFFDPAPPPPPPEKKKKGLSMKKIVEGVKKIEKENEMESDKETEEPELFANPDKISAPVVPEVPTTPSTPPVKEKQRLETRKIKKMKLKVSKEAIQKAAIQKDKKKLKIFSKSKSLAEKSFKKSKKMKERFSKKQFIKMEARPAIEMESGDEQSELLREIQFPHLKFPKEDQIKEVVARMSRAGNRKSTSISPQRLPTPSRSSRNIIVDQPFQPPADTRRRGRPRKIPPLRGMPIPPGAIEGLGRALMSDSARPLKIKKSHMEPDVRNLVPDVQLSTKPPKMQPVPTAPTQQTPNFNLLRELSSQPGLIPSNYNLPPPPPLIKIPTASPSKEVSTKGGPFQSLPTSVCSSVTITPIDMPGQKLPTRHTVTPGIGSPLLSSPSKSSKVKEKSSAVAAAAAAALPVPIKTEPASGITITPIVMDNNSDKFEEMDMMQLEENEDEDEGEKKPSVSMLAKLEEDFKSKEQRKKEKERRKEKKEKKKEKRDRMKEKKEKRERADKKKKRAEKGSAAGVVAAAAPPPPALSVPKLTLKISTSGTPTPVDSPNPPQVTIGESSPPLPKKITIKPIEEQRKRTPSPELARFSPLVTRTPKPSRAAKAHAAAAVAAEAMGATLSHQKSFPPAAAATAATTTTPVAKRGRGRPSKGAAGAEKASKPAKATQGALVTETVGCIIDEQGNKIWICPQCGRQDDGSPMIGCDLCDDWYHFTCVGILETPAEDKDWYCPRCVSKKKRK